MLQTRNAPATLATTPHPTQVTTMHTTLNAIREHNPCSPGWKTLLASLNKTAADDDRLPLSRILESNGLDDTLWAFRAVGGHDREKRLFAVWCARQVQHLNDDPRVKNAIDVAERYANGGATESELREARAYADDDAYAATSQTAELARVLAEIDAGRDPYTTC